jgi:hypothetical protein
MTNDYPPHAVRGLANPSLGLAFVPDGAGGLAATVGPEDGFHDICAIFHMRHDLRETRRLMGEIDALISGWPLE